MKKIGLLCLALVLALGTLGVGYAMWSDEVTIEGTVNTGSVEITIEDLSETYVYKDLSTHGIVMSDVEIVDPNLLPVASATAEDVTVYPDGAKTVEMTFDNIFPTYDPIVADVLLHYTGSIPVHVDVSETFGGDDLSPYLVQDWLLSTDDGVSWRPIEQEMLQLHYCNLVWLVVYLDPELLQNAGKDAQGLSGTFTKTITVYQWNEPLP